MQKIIDIETVIKIAEGLKTNGKTIVLVGGCFDIIHIGHIQFLKKAKLEADFLFLLLESDTRIKELKGNHRPINPQSDRASVLESVIFTDYIVLLPHFKSNEEYDEMIYSLKPDIIATTKTDPGRIHKKRQAKKLGIRVVEVLDKIENRSTSRIARLLKKEL